MPSVARFLVRVLETSGRYRTELVSLPMSSRDDASLRLCAPSTWRRGVRSVVESWEGRAVTRVGVRGAELEFQRYRPRPTLTRHLQRFERVIVVAGAPTWALATRNVTRPVALQVATLTAVERRALLERSHGARGLWLRLMTRMAARIERRGLRSVDRVFVENAWMYERLSREIGSELVVLAPPGVDTERFRPAPCPPPGPAPVLAVGRFSDPRKRVDLLFEAYALLCKRDVATPPLLLAGASAPSAADWAQAEGLGIRARIEMREDVRDDELLELYRGARLLVLCSDEEGLGLVLLEAMACGLPVVATDCGGPRTLVVHGETGLLTPSGDAVRLADALGSLLGDTERCRRLGAAARARAVERFSLRTAGAPFLAWCDEPARSAPH